MVKISKKGRGATAGGSSGRGGGRGAGRGAASNGRGGGGGRGPQTLKTNKGTFVFQRVTDGLYIEHQWGKNSGHIGIAQESLAAFTKTLVALAESSGAVRLRPHRLPAPELSLARRSPGDQSSSPPRDAGDPARPRQREAAPARR